MIDTTSFMIRRATDGCFDSICLACFEKIVSDLDPRSEAAIRNAVKTHTCNVGRFAHRHLYEPHSVN